VKAIADHGARFVGCNVMYLKDGSREHFMRFLQQEFPAMRPRMERLYAKAYPPEHYRREVKAMVSLLEQRHGLGRAAADEEIGPPAGRSVPDWTGQAAFRW
jgi:hypothetical protein